MMSAIHSDETKPVIMKGGQEVQDLLVLLIVADTLALLMRRCSSLKETECVNDLGSFSILY
jgi:hypothetical protein